MKRAPNPTKTSQPYIPSYQKGGLVTKPIGLQSWEKVDGKIVTGTDLENLEQKRDDEKAVTAAKSASKFSSKAKAFVHDAISGAGALMNQGRTAPRDSEMGKLKKTESRGKEAQKRLEAGNREKAK
jgi:hypothetical protein